MNLFVEAIKTRLTDEDIYFLDRIYEPRVVASPHSEGFRSMCVLPDGEIRCYGEINKPTRLSKGEAVYISSTDGGLSFKMHRQIKGSMGPSVKSPYSERWITPRIEGDNAYMLIGSHPDCTDYKKVPLNHHIGSHHLPIPLVKKKRWIFAADYYQMHSTVFFSDDDGDSWTAVEIEESDHFSLTEPHKSVRWENSGVEPSIVELSDGTLMMMLRTSTDYHYVSYSHDYGESWSRPEPTAFHSTLTSPEFLKLKDGRIVFFFNNTRPLPEEDKTMIWPELCHEEITGFYEDVFTNRDANCAVISSDDGKSWDGFREIKLNDLRNTCDFRTSDGPNKSSGQDKSVHQFQAIELPFNKIMVHLGQHELVSKIVIFDVDWLYEKKRVEDFTHGMGNVSTQVYLKSISGCSRGKTGHCAWNRTNGAVPVPDPSGDRTEAILIKNTNDDRLVSNAQGIVWNFPAAQKGVIKITLSIMGDGVRISLLDHWTNPIDLYTEMYANFTMVAQKHDMKNLLWNEIIIEFDSEKKIAVCKNENIIIGELQMKNSAPNGLCYLHLQTVSESGDEIGTLIKKLDFSCFLH